MRVELTPEQSSMIRTSLDDAIFQLVSQNRERLFKNGQSITPLELKDLFQGIVRDGHILLDVPVKKSQGGYLVDKNQCEVPDMKDYTWEYFCGEKNIRKLVIEISSVILETHIFPYTCIVKTKAKSIVVHDDLNDQFSQLSITH